MTEHPAELVAWDLGAFSASLNCMITLTLSGLAFSVIHQAGGGGGGGGQGYHQPVAITFRMSHYILKSMPDEKFESGSFSSFGDTALMQGMNSVCQVCSILSF